MLGGVPLGLVRVVGFYSEQIIALELSSVNESVDRGVAWDRFLQWMAGVKERENVIVSSCF